MSVWVCLSLCSLDSNDLEELWEQTSFLLLLKGNKSIQALVTLYPTGTRIHLEVIKDSDFNINVQILIALQK